MSYEQENNSTRTTANLLNIGEIMYGKISMANDGDCFKVYLRSGHIKFALTIPINTNYRMRIFLGDESNSVIENIDVACYTNRTCEYDIPIGRSGDYYIVITPQATNPIYNANVYYTLLIIYTRINLPVNINQHYFSALSGKCANACSLGISMYYRNLIVTEAIVTNEVAIYANQNYTAVPNVSFNESYKNGSVSTSTVYTKAVENIKLGKPMMIHYYDTPTYDLNNSKSHWVVAVGYNETNGNIDNLTVSDPSTRNTSTYYNTNWSFIESKSYNMSSVLTFYYGYVTTSAV